MTAIGVDILERIAVNTEPKGANPGHDVLASPRLDAKPYVSHASACGHESCTGDKRIIDVTVVL